MRPERTAVWTAIALGVSLVISNAWWLYVSFDSAITASYREDQYTWTKEALDDALALIPAIEPMARKPEVIAFAQQLSEFQAFEKDGCVWFDNLGIKFDDEERIVHVSRRWNFGEEDPCFPR